MKKLKFVLLQRTRYETLSRKSSQLEETIENAQVFIRQMENGNLSEEVDLQELETNSLMHSLISMRNKMREIAEQEKKRNWSTEGLARFVDILRSKNDNLQDLGEAIIVNIVKYLGANQGSLYFINNDGAEALLELIGCYAYDRKKYRNHQIRIGEGLSGQAVLEKEMIYMTNLPADYLKITSGLGEALPRNLLILPLLLNDQVYGVIELASFNVFENHHRDFLKKLGESVASTIANVRVNQQTRKLLEETQAQTELMRAQEEEMRQNMEEITATQEEMSRIVNAAQEKEGYVKEFMNACSDLIFTVDRNRDIMLWNHAFQKTVKALHATSVVRGSSVKLILSGPGYDEILPLIDEAFSGKTVVETSDLFSDKLKAPCEIRLAPLRNLSGDIFEVVIMLRKEKTNQLQAKDSHLQPHSVVA